MEDGGGPREDGSQDQFSTLPQRWECRPVIEDHRQYGTHDPPILMAVATKQHKRVVLEILE